MVDFDKKIKELQENKNGINYTFTIERINILKTLSFVYDKLNEEEEMKLDELMHQLVLII